MGARGEVQRPCRSAQRALDTLDTVCRITRRFNHEGKLTHLLLHDGGQRVVGVRFYLYLLHGSEEPAGSIHDAAAVRSGHSSRRAAYRNAVGRVIHRKGITARTEKIVRRGEWVAPVSVPV